ncbi:DEAD/DEAH box helicase [Paraferrimonas haliotis]|uniref:DEAD/DEAH box helicase n=1 Tax=Paraferrimonas haliotis TaxID=2013866 RepID=A0AA37TNF6_9GAMM|nr:DEAD/DEAH box helicase [Paraferrimonas haliotis]GLS83668.1 DEAD/DEAH box helicase [Paraferrimonas haliotis]
MGFDKLGLSSELLNSLSALGFSSPTPIQTQAIPVLLQGHDVLAAAQTGTGKTAAFGLPLMQHLLQAHNPAERGHTKALILTPTRELAQQVLDSLKALNQHLSNEQQFKLVAVYGGVSIKAQQAKLDEGVDILVATPGRLLDHVYSKKLSLKTCQFVVFDEADRMLDMGFMPDIKKVLRLLPKQPQMALFSATFSAAIKRLAYGMMQTPKEISVSPSNSAAELVEQMVYPVDKKRKAELLAHLIGQRNWQQVLVFVRTKEGSEALAKELGKDGIQASAINGDKSQGARQRALDDFKAGKLRALIATDVAARGLDIHQLEQVVNFDMPFKAEDYVHRIGRTGRAGHKGLAISLMSQSEEGMLAQIERLLDERLPQQWLSGYEPSEDSGDIDTGHRNSKPLSANAQRRKLKQQMLKDAGLLKKKKRRR